MKKNLNLKRGKELKELLNKASVAYYNLDKQSDLLMSDMEYDTLYAEYQEIENKFPELKNDSSPTILVGSEIVSNLEKITHLSPLLSINLKSKVEKDILKWYKDVGGEGTEILITPKLDGITVDTVYNNGKFDYAATRGTGYIGEVISHNIKPIKSTLMEILETNTLEVRGEGIIHVKDFWDKWSNEYSNPRNLAAGTLRQLDSAISIEKEPDVVYYDLGVNSKNFKTDVEQLEFLKELGFKIIPYILINNSKDLIKYCMNKMDNMIVVEKGFNVLKNIDVMCDGLVLKVNDLKLREEIGFTSKGPKFAFAVKFKSLTATTKLIDVVVNTGRSGRITPTAILESVKIGGVNISSATLNNFDYINSMSLVDSDGAEISKNQGVRKGDTILLERANDVIPRIIGVIETNDTNKIIEIPTNCSSCGKPIAKIGGLHFCENINCNKRLKGAIELFVSRDAMNIVDFGEKNIDLFMEKGYIKKITDIYNLKDYKEEIIKIKGYGIRKIEKILKSIEKSKEQPFENVLYSLGITSVGRRMSKTLVKEFKNIDNLINATETQLMSISDVGTETTQTIINFFKNEGNIEVIEEFKKLNLNFEKEEDLNSTDLLKDKTFVITGSFSKNRKEIQNIIETNGGKAVGSVSKKTTYVIVGEDAGSKEVKARELVAKGENVKIIEGDEGLITFFSDLNIKY